MDAIELERALAVAREAVAAAGAAALRFLRSGIVVETKPDRSPVTAADRAAEDEIVAIIRASFPDHAILGEERGMRAGNTATRWIVDPIDGTRGFARGGIMWGPMVALEVNGELVVGAFALPAQGVTYWATRGGGAFRDGTRLAVSDIADLGEATLSVGELGRMPQAPIAELVGRVASTRCYGDIAGCALVLDGRAEAWIEGGVEPWDLAVPAILVAEAGGRFTDWTGVPTFEHGYGIASNGRVHDELLSVLDRSA